ncbi:hypothetical protein AB0C59_31040 [Streptomyces sp. NPDC048664]|uniref:uridine kinase family protein n=1 Tax=Streptomyces sp. NPDC048664 TaxID=3154505 RepID=UPI00343731E3
MRGLASRLRHLPPSCGPVRLVGVDGHAGSGKSTFAARLAAELDGAPVLRLDDIATHQELFDWSERLLREVIEPLGQGRTAHYRPYDWRARRPGPVRALPPAPVILIEGVGAGRRALRPHLALLLWMDMPRKDSWARGRARDGAEQEAFWDGWTEAEREHFDTDPSRPHAGLLVRQAMVGPQGSEAVKGARGTEGYEVRPGPAGAADAGRVITHGDDPSAVC